MIIIRFMNLINSVVLDLVERVRLYTKVCIKEDHRYIIHYTLPSLIHYLYFIVYEWEPVVSRWGG